MAKPSLDSLDTRRRLQVGEASYEYFSLAAANEAMPGVDRLPVSLKILLENLLRHEDGQRVGRSDLGAVVDWLSERRSQHEIAFHPARVLMQDFTGVPAAVDLAAMRDAMGALGGDPARINPVIPVDLVIDHSVSVDHYGNAQAFARNVAVEMDRNRERYALLRWTQQAFDNFRVVPPGTGICHQVNLEYLAQVAWRGGEGRTLAVYPDTLLGTDSHTTMVNGLSVLGWGVGGIEAEAALLGQPLSMIIPEVVGFRLSGRLSEGSTATDLVLTVTQMLREHGVVGKFVEFFGTGLDQLSLPDRATIANMAPEYGATCGFFPVDAETLRYLSFSGRPAEQVALVEAYAKAQGLWRAPEGAEPQFSAVLELDLGSVEPSLAGPKRPQDRIALSRAAGAFRASLGEAGEEAAAGVAVDLDGQRFELRQGAVVIAAITSCTNTSNPDVMVAAGLLARNAVARGLRVPPWVKTSLAPGSQVVYDYLRQAELQPALEALGFHLVGYGCTTCIGNSGPLHPALAEAIKSRDLTVCSVLSGNRNFEGRINLLVRNNYLASPPLVVAYALAGNMGVDLLEDPLGKDAEGRAVYLREIWPTQVEIRATVARCLSAQMFRDRYADVFSGPPEWRGIDSGSGRTYRWDPASTYVRHPTFFAAIQASPTPPSDILGARILALLGDSVTTDHISPAGSIPVDSPAGRYLLELGVGQVEFNSYGSRRGNHELMTRGTFANPRLSNQMVAGVKGGVTRHQPGGEQMSIFEAAERYRAEGVPLVVIAGREYGTGSSRDWAAKGTRLLGVRAVIAESFERIHRSNLVGMGVLPLEFAAGTGREQLALDGSETLNIAGLDSLQARSTLTCELVSGDGSRRRLQLRCRIDTDDELAYFRHDGILPYVLRQLRGG